MKKLLVLAVTVGLGSVIVTLLVGSGRYERTVVSEPYEAGLRWDADRKDRESSGWMVKLAMSRVMTGKQDLELSVSDRTGRPLEGAAVEVRFLRPFTLLADRTFQTQQLPSGAYRLAVDIPEQGRWDLQISVQQGGRRIIFDETIYAEPR